MTRGKQGKGTGRTYKKLINLKTCTNRILGTILIFHTLLSLSLFLLFLQTGRVRGGSGNETGDLPL